MMITVTAKTALMSQVSQACASVNFAVATVDAAACKQGTSKVS